MDNSEDVGWTKSLRFKALMDLREPFPHEVMLEIENGKEIWVNVKYERLPNLCYYCGKVGHVEKDCLEREAVEEEEGQVSYEYTG